MGRQKAVDQFKQKTIEELSVVKYTEMSKRRIFSFSFDFVRISPGIAMSIIQFSFRSFFMTTMSGRLAFLLLLFL